MTRSFLSLLRNDLAFKPENLVVFHLAAPDVDVAAEARFATYYWPMLQALRAVPGVQGAAFTNLRPIQDGAATGTSVLPADPQWTQPE